MKFGVTLRNMGPQSTAATMRGGAAHAEALGFESVWITDHIAIPPDDAVGSGGRYTDPLTTLAWLGGATARIKLGVGVLILPYRPALPTVKQIATVHELTGERLLLGVGAGWMDAEFRALGVDRRRRGKLTDDVLEHMNDAFASHVAERNGQPFIVAPRPAAPPTYVGGRAPHALARALRFGHGWLPMASDPAALARDLEAFDRLATDSGKKRGPITVMAGIDANDPVKARATIDAYAALGIERLVFAQRYVDLDEYRQRLDALATLVL